MRRVFPAMAMLLASALATTGCSREELLAASPSTIIVLGVEPAALTLTVNQSQVVRGTVQNPPGNELGPIWQSENPAFVGVVANGLSATVVCLSATLNGPVGVLFDATHERANNTARVAVTCVAPPTATPPPTTPAPPPAAPAPPATPADTVGTYTKNGTRTPASNCNPPVLLESFSGSLAIAANSGGNLGVVFTQTVGALTLPYSQFTATTNANGVHFTSGTPVRTINGVDYTTQIEIDVTGNGISGRETFTRVNPPCTDVYTITGTKR